MQGLGSELPLHQTEAVTRGSGQMSLFIEESENQSD